MIKANHTFSGDLFFDWYSRIGLSRNFREIHVDGEFRDNGKPLLLISNHFSWWDGFIQLWLNNTVLKRKFHVMMLEDQLRNHRILSQAGAFSVNKNSRELAESLRYTVGLLEQPANLVVIFPQGEIQTLYTRDFKFGRGIEYIIRKAGADAIDILFNVNLIDYFSCKKPGLYIYFNRYDTANGTDLETIRLSFNRYFEVCVNKQK